MRALKVTISGSYKASEDKIVSFSNVSGVIPYQEEETASQHIRRRYALMWVMNDPKFKEHIRRTRETFIDQLEETEAEFSFVGKDIRDMTQEELQDLATAKDLKLVPLYKKGSDTQARMVAYADYSEQVLKEKVDYRAVGFKFAQQPPIIVNDSAWRRDTTVKLTNDEVLQQEADAMAGKGAKTKLSRSELEKIARSQNVQFRSDISDEKLYEKIYG